MPRALGLLPGESRDCKLLIDMRVVRLWTKYARKVFTVGKYASDVASFVEMEWQKAL